MRVADRDPRQRRQLARKKIDAVVDQESPVELGRLSDQTSLEEMLGLLAGASDDGVDGLTDLRRVARQRDLLLQLHQLRATPLGGIAVWDVVHLRRRREFFRRVDERTHLVEL